MTQTITIRERAKQGDVDAIASLIREWLSPQDLRVEVKPKGDCLRVLLESTTVPNQIKVVPPVRDRLRALDLQEYKTLKIVGKDTEDEIPDWYQEFELSDSTFTFSKPNTPTEHFKLESVLEQVAGVAGGVMGTASEAGKIVSGVGEAVGNVAQDATKTVLHTATGVGDAVSEVTLKASKQIGSTFGWINKNPITRQISKALPFNWLFIVDSVDLVKAASQVEKLQQEYPSETPSEIAHRLMVNKATLSAGSGLFSSLVPGFAAALFAVDLAATMALQAELVYQIAYAYGFDIRSSDRKGEAMTILGLALGGGQALKVGGSFAARAGFLGLLRNIPLAGAAIGMSTNAAMTYALGYTACRFYETQNSSMSSEAALAASTVASEEYVQEAIAQEVVMDTILVHLVKADNPYKTNSEIIHELETLNLSPASMEAIRANIDSLPSIDSLLNQLKRDYALPLLVKSYQVTQLDGEVKPEAANIIDSISQRFEIDLNSLKAVST